MPYVDIYFDLTYKRAKTWGMTNFVWPVLLLGMMLLSLFTLPADSGEKISFACMTFLTFMVVNQSISEDIPRSEEAPLISEFLKHAIILNAMSIFATAFVLTLHCSENSFSLKFDMKRFPRYVFLQILPAVLRVKPRKKKRPPALFEIDTWKFPKERLRVSVH